MTEHDPMLDDPGPLSVAQRTAVSWVAEHAASLSADHLHLWRLAEPSWREYRSSAWFVARLRAEGFAVEESSAGMPTAFAARWTAPGTPDGAPVLATIAEYDAVPGTSQEPVPRRAPRAGTHLHAPGHTDPHSALGIGALAGTLAAKAAMERHGLKGTLVLMGEPAEKMCGSKPVHAAHGYYDGFSAAISWHPTSFLSLANSCLWDTHCATYWSRIYTFECLAPETWSSAIARTGVHSSHSVSRAPGAIDAVCLMYTAAKYLKENMLPHQGAWSLNEAILQAGQATADNLPPGLSVIQYALRAPTIEMQERVWTVLDRNADHVAAMTHCTVTKAWVTKTRPGLANHALAEATFRNFARLGPPVYGEGAKRFANDLRAACGAPPVEDPFPPEITRLCSPRQAEAALRAHLPPWQKNYTSDDYTEWTWHCPTARLYVGRAQLRVDEPGRNWPDWTRHAMGGVPACIDPMWLKAAEVTAATFVELLERPEALAAARAEFERRTGGGIGGTTWLGPLLPRNFPAPIHYRWPEYASTPRGEEYVVPDPALSR
ncbi:zinc-binding metallopeptidase family protein [Elioraea tepida]|jgi:aminobenzoyl-glutamate utilization protein B|nr:amidohydrolase [Elioraea tepida]